MKRVLVTGANGFIGRHSLLPLIRRGYEVHAAYLGQPAPGVDDADWIEADLLRDGAARELIERVRPTHLLHFAWYVAPGDYWTSPQNLTWVRASIELLQEFAGHGGQRAAMAGTCAEYDWRHGCCSEALTPLEPATLYGACKHALRLMLDTYGRQSGLSTAWGRVFLLYGPHEHPRRLVSSVCRSVLLGETARCSHGNQMRDILHVEDVADAFVALLESDVTGAVNIASGQPVRLKDVIMTIAREAGRPELVELGAIEAPANEPPILVGDVRRLAEEVGWSPHYDLETGIRNTLHWWRDQLSREKG